MGSPSVVKLPPRLYDIAVLLARFRSLPVSELAVALGRREQDVMRDLAELEARGFIRVLRREVRVAEVSDSGRRYLDVGLPEERLVEVLLKTGRLSFSDLRGLGMAEDELNAAIGILRRCGVAEIGREGITLKSERVRALNEYVERVKGRLREYLSPREFKDEEIDRELRRRGLISVREVKDLRVEATEVLLSVASSLTRGEVVTVVTPEVISLSNWDHIEFKPFDLSVEPPKLRLARKHFFVDIIDYMREVMVSLGFEEVKGPHVELELWNFDVLFVPQYHPSRRPTDVYRIKGGGQVAVLGGAPVSLVNEVKRYHEAFAGYTWDQEKALRLILRTHCTAVSVRTLFERGEGEYRVFTIDRVFRPDTPDPTHLMEFHQLDGIMVGRNISFKDLLQFFREFARALGLGEVRFKPAYFPFTEPSVEGYVKHPKLGWVEVLPGGMFRRQVLEPLGLHGYNVAAWGIGVDRIAMILLGIDDIRELYSDDIREVEIRRPPKVVLGAGGLS
ncbi:MAG: phenylalanine--tRNA ligase subunit alpha [Desulfurococcaceae archaeon]|jgi:phenylalanyl-tRNA synthetase alpha chain|nr:phenylalanine--tRNA ligase subunit alpha [Desulfurococcaceae archaeon]